MVYIHAHIRLTLAHLLITVYAFLFSVGARKASVFNTKKVQLDMKVHEVVSQCQSYLLFTSNHVVSCLTSNKLFSQC